MTTETPRDGTNIEKAVLKEVLTSSVKGVPDGSIITDGDVYLIKESAGWVDRIDKNRTILRSKSEAIGKIARSGLQCGEFIYAEQLSLPIMPQKGERWHFHFPNDVLKKHVGERITLKGEMFKGDDGTFRILSYDSTGRIALLGKFGKNEPDSNRCVLATGVLRRIPKVKNAPLLLYGFDADAVTISPATW
ncbi:MAG: hypothetical protein IAF58_03645 [Leptolyngbya sp.]|nr:hypothetical protein [Candidatus Melainabacteria bacterium]